jgi:hypothetical protein
LVIKFGLSPHIARGVTRARSGRLLITWLSPQRRAMRAFTKGSYLGPAAPKAPVLFSNKPGPVRRLARAPPAAAFTTTRAAGSRSSRHATQVPDLTFRSQLRPGTGPGPARARPAITAPKFSPPKIGACFASGNCNVSGKDHPRLHP